MDILQMGAELIRNKLGQDFDLDQITNGLNGLLSDADGKINIQDLVGNLMQDGGLQGIIDSWLGDGSNAPISADQIKGIFGQEKVQSFANELGVSAGNISDSLAEAIPQMIDKSSSGGSLLDNVSDLGSLLGSAGKLFG